MSNQTDPPPSGAAAPLRQRLRAGLAPAMRGRDPVAVTALRSALAAIDNAEAVQPAADRNDPLAIELTPLGVGAAEVERRVLTEEQVERIVHTEIAERESAAQDYDRADHPDRAHRLRGEAAVLAAYLSVGG